MEDLSNFDPNDIARIRQMQGLGPMQASNQSVGPLQSFQQMPSPMRVPGGGGEDSPGLSQPPPQMAKPAPNDENTPVDVGDDVVATGDAAKGFQKESPLKDLMVTKEDLDSANKRKKMALALGMIGDAFANGQSAGNFYLGRMNPHHDIQGFAQKMAGLADAPIEQKKILLAQQLKQPEMELAMRSSDPTSSESQMMGSMMKAAIQNNSELEPDQKMQMLKTVDGKSAVELNQMAAQPIFKDLRDDNKLFQTLNNKVELANAKNEMMRHMMDNTNSFRERGLGLREGNQEMVAGSKYSKEMGDAENQILAANKANHIIEGIKAGDLVGTSQLKSDLSGALASMMNNGKPATVYGMSHQEFDSLYGRAQTALGIITGQTPGTITDAQLTQLKKDIAALRDQYQKQREIKFNALKETMPETVQPKLQNRFDSFTKGAIGGADKPQATGGTVQMRDPNGNIRAIPADQVEAAKAAGGVPL